MEKYKQSRCFSNILIQQPLLIGGICNEKVISNSIST